MLSLGHSRTIAFRFNRSMFGVIYQRPAGRSMLDESGALIDERVREGLDTINLPPPTSGSWRGFYFEHQWMGHGLPRASDGQGGDRALTAQEMNSLAREEFMTRVERFAVGVPTWLILLLTGLSPILYLTGPRRRHRVLLHRRRNNLCLKCGYDLRDSTDRCPECGGIAAA
jgi:hypothetical protein